MCMLDMLRGVLVERFLSSPYKPNLGEGAQQEERTKKLEKVDYEWGRKGVNNRERWHLLKHKATTLANI